jgi:nucleoid DNA-binding protein
MCFWTINFLQLRPIKRKQISEKVAEKLKLSAEIVDEIMTCYFRAVQKKLSALDHDRVAVDGLGTFYIKRRKLEQKLTKYKDALARYEAKPDPNMSDYSSIRDMKFEIEKFERALSKMDYEADRKALKQQDKEDYKNKNNESN